MADVPTTSQSQSSTSRPRTRRAVDTRPNPEPTLAFGFVLNYECRLRWANQFMQEYEESGDDTFTPEQCEAIKEGLLFAIITGIPERIYHVLPDVPRVRKELLPVVHPELGFDDFVFVLRDNSTIQRLHSPLTQENIEAIRKALGLPDDQQPKWVRIPIF
ncbi:hypothetical protein V8D89_005137 [Ganoderma adspersum]